ncbi:anaphase-promoting complex subunit 2-like isoform X2 [Varroa destructor]|uniref:Anaphase-promoting complex subunit 2 n=1 Tax=Varroa destructor TaxID=109461 RepID=A0A7M7JR85_VARDE|nr:anaphase-promoting complex subunit 2-like isoform X2 [Varroa destructor]
MGSNHKQLTARAVDDLNQRWGAVESALRMAVLQGIEPSDTVAQHVRVLCGQADGMGRIAQLWLLTLAEKVIKKTMRTFFAGVTTVEDILPALETMTIDVNRLLSAARWLEAQCQSVAEIGEEAMEAESADCSPSKGPQLSCSQSEGNKDRMLPKTELLEVEVLEAVSRISSAQLTPQVDAFMLQLFQQSFRAFHKTQSREDCSELVFCPGCGADIVEDEDTACRCAQLMRDFVRVNELLDKTHVFPTLLHDCVRSVAFERIRGHVRDTCQGDFESKCAANLETWLNDTVGAWLQTIAGPASSVVSTFKKHLLYFLLDIFIDFRAGQLFDMIVDFPDSQPALEDLRDCIAKVRSVDKLVAKLREAMERRLFHPGVKTADIITAYVSTIKALRILDPSGVILQSVCEPLSLYLKSRDNRDNTVRIIVSSLTDENNVELSAELAKCSQKGPIDSYGGSSDDEEGDGDWQRWVPHARVSKMIRSSDIITLLVNIYGSKEVFVEEYASLLAERLLNGTSDTHKEILYMELLKIIEEKLQGQLRIPFDVLVVSVQFWPELKEETLKIPREVTEDFDKFRKEYEILNGNRTVNLKPQLGYVDLDVEMDDGTCKTFKCSTGQAALINLFHEHNQWKMSDIASTLECSRITVKRWASFWVSTGILREAAGGETLVVAASGEDVGAETGVDDPIDEVDDDEEDTPKANKQMETKYQVYWSFVRGLLTNLGQAPLDRVFSMLSMFVSQASQEFTLQDCKHFLDTKVRSSELIYQGGVYTLAK